MWVIFLDIDGVLNADCDFGGKSKPNPRVYSDDGNSYCGICKSHVKVLKKIVDRTGAKLVLTSSWKNDYDDYIRHGYCNRVGKYLHNKLRALGLSIYDTTLKYDFSNGKNRGYEISQWLEDHPEVDRWIVLDDEKFDDYDFLKITQNLILIDPKYGLWKLSALQAIYKLTNEKDPWLEAHEKFTKIFGEVTAKIFNDMAVTATEVKGKETDE